MLERIHGVEIELRGDGGSTGTANGTWRCCASRTRRSTTRFVTLAPRASWCAWRAMTGACAWRSPTTVPGSIQTLPEVRAKHLGLTSMEERARELGGRLQIRSSARTGTTVTLEVPG